jgi:hypothetical protein
MPLLHPTGRKPIYDTERIRNRGRRTHGPNKPRGLVGSDGSKDSTHYGGADNPHEVIKCLEAWGLEKDALLWNAVKYVARSGKKIDQPTLKDLKKALYYLKRRVEKLEEAKA